MARSDYPVPFAIKTVAEGLSARQGLQIFRSEGGRVNDSRWFRLVGEVRRSLADRLVEPTRPLGRRPTADEITVLETKRHTGYRQEVEIYVLNRDTGEVEAKPYVWRTDEPIPRGQAISEAVAEFEAGVQDSPDEFNETILGGAYIGTQRLVPREESP